MKRLTIILLVILTMVVAGCEKKGDDIDMDSNKDINRSTNRITNYSQLNDVKGTFTINDLMFIDKDTTRYKILEEIGKPDAVTGLDENYPIDLYKLADGGILKIQIINRPNGQHRAYIVYKDLIVVLYATDNFCKSVGKLEGIDTVKCLKDIN